MSRLLVGLAVLALLVGATTTAAPVPVHLMRKGPPLYFPTWVGAKWVYEDGTKGVFGDINWTFSVTAVEETDAGALVTIAEHRSDGKTSLHQKVLVTPAGLADVGDSRCRPASPQWMLKIPCEVEAKWEVDYSSEDFKHTGHCDVLGTEEVEVPAGKFTAVRVRSTRVSGPRGGGPFAGIERTCDEWYAPRVGIVKREYLRLGQAPYVLKSFTP